MALQAPGDSFGESDAGTSTNEERERGTCTNDEREREAPRARDLCRRGTQDASTQAAGHIDAATQADPSSWDDLDMGVVTWGKGSQPICGKEDYGLWKAQGALEEGLLDRSHDAEWGRRSGKSREEPDDDALSLVALVC